MANLEAGTTLQRLRHRYRLVIMNDDTYEEVVTFRLTRMSVYIAMSTIFVLLVGLTVALIVFTPLKYYIPGYGNAKADKEYRQLKYVSDSLARQVASQGQFINGLQQVLRGNTELKLDTTQFKIPEEEITTE